MKAKSFFFINKTADSDHLTHSPGRQWIEIQKHVQTGRKRPRKSKLKVSPKKPSLLDDRALYDATIRSISCKFDPFNATSIPIDSTVRSLIHYYIYNYHPTLWTYNPETPHGNPYAFKDSVVQVVNTAIGDALVMYSLLAASVSRIHHVDNIAFPSAAFKEHTFMSEALRLMQKRVESRPLTVEGLVVCIMFLGSAEAYRDNLPAARIHLQTALKLLEPEGGVMAMRDKNVQGQVLMADLFLSCVNMEPCLCGYEYDPGPAAILDLGEGELIPCDGLSDGTKLLGMGDEMLPMHLRRLVFEILETHKINQQLNTASMTPERAFQTTHWVAKRNMAIRSKILANSIADARINAFKTALVMWTLLSMNITGRVKTVKKMALSLKATLEGIPDVEWVNHESLFLWIQFVGYSCARDGSYEQQWFSDQIVRNGRWLRESSIIFGPGGTFAEVEAFLRGHLYSPLQRSRIKAIASLLETLEL